MRDQALDQTTYLAFLVYHIMEKSGDWGQAGQDQSQVTFCRWMLGISPDETITYEQSQEFSEKVDDQLKSLEIHQMPADFAEKRIKDYQMTILGESFRCQDMEKIDVILQFMNTGLFYYLTRADKGYKIILFEGKKEFRMGYDVYTLEREVVRTPNIVVSMAAMITGHQILIRKEALETIYVQKWVPVFEDDPLEQAMMEADPNQNVAEGIKRHTLSLYDVDTVDKMKSNRELFVNEMAETITQHEIGHGAVQNEILDIDIEAIGNGTKVFGETIFTSLLEFFADFFPETDGVIGAIQNLIDISKTDTKRAERMFYMYFSDTWFFDTDDVFMYTYSYLLAMVLIRYVKKDLSVDFKKLEKDIQFDPAFCEDKPETMFEKMIQIFELGSKSIRRKLERTTFRICDEDWTIAPDDQKYKSGFWLDAIHYSRLYSKTGEKNRRVCDRAARQDLEKSFCDDRW